MRYLVQYETEMKLNTKLTVKDNRSTLYTCFDEYVVHKHEKSNLHLVSQKRYLFR